MKKLIKKLPQILLNILNKRIDRRVQRAVIIDILLMDIGTLNTAFVFQSL